MAYFLKYSEVGYSAAVLAARHDISFMCSHCAVGCRAC
jgi:hypothetical protein